MPRFFGSADEEELARRRAVGDMRGTTGGMGPALNRGQYFAYGSNAAGQVTTPVFTNAPQAQAFAQSAGTGVRQVSPDAPAQPRYFGSNIAPIRNSAPGRTPTMFSNVPGDRSLLERDMMQSARGSGASRRALMAERQQYDAGQEQTRRMEMGEQKRKAEQEEARLDRQNKLDVARATGTGGAEVTARSRLEVARFEAKEARDRLDITQRHEIDKIDLETDKELELIERQGLDKESKDAAVETAHMRRIELLQKTGNLDIALEEAKALILSRTVSTEEQTQTTNEKDGKITVTKEKGTSFTQPEGLPGQGEQDDDVNLPAESGLSQYEAQFDMIRKTDPTTLTNPADAEAYAKWDEFFKSRGIDIRKFRPKAAAAQQ